MKKSMMLRTLLASAVLCMSVAFVACQKSEISSPKEIKKNNVSSQRHTGGFTKQEYYFYGMFLGCPMDGVNCWDPPIEVHGNAPGHVAVLNEVFQIVQSGSQNQIAQIFEENRDVLVEYYHDEYVDGVINHTYTVEYAFYNQAHYLRFKQNGQTLATYPLILGS